jgi:NADH-quinone oxidoreductase subunit N
VFVPLSTLQALAPEIVLIFAASLAMVGSALRPSRVLWGGLALLACALAAGLLASVDAPSFPLDPLSPLVFDPLHTLFRWSGLVLAALVVLVAWRWAEPSCAGEMFGSALVMAAGIMLVAGANELVLLFVALELVSIPTYVLLLLGRRDRAAGEASLKYFFLSLLSSVLLLYGLTLLYGLGGTTRLAGTDQVPGLRELLGQDLSSVAGPLKPLVPLAVVLLVAGLGFRLTVAPWQFYAPDVYQGTTSVNALLLAVAPKLVGVTALIRLLLVALPAGTGLVWQLALVLALVTMTLGNVAALWQRHLRRLMAYSAIAHGGYLLIGLAAAAAAASLQRPGMSGQAGEMSQAGVFAATGGAAAMVLYVLVYGLATAGFFAALVHLGSLRREVQHVEELAGLARTDPLLAAAVAVLLLSLAGLPPLAGFWGKLQLFLSAVGQASADHTATPAIGRWFALLAMVGVLNAAIAAAYYLRVVAVMYFQPPVAAPAAEGGRLARLGTLGCALLVLVLGAWPGGLMQLAMQAEQGLAKSQPVSAQQQTPGAAVLADRGAARPATSAIAEAHSAGN